MTRERFTEEIGAGARFHDAGDRPAALRRYRRAVALAPARIEAVGSAGLLLLETDSREAAPWCRRSVALDPCNVAALHNLALALGGAEAGRSLRQILALEPVHVEGSRLQATAARDRGELHRSSARLFRVLASTPHAVAALVDAADVLRQLGRLDDAWAAIRSAVALAPNVVGVLNAAGVRSYMAMEEEGASTFYRRGLAIDRLHPALWSNLGRTVLRQGNVRDACGSFRRALTLAPAANDAVAGLAFAEATRRSNATAMLFCRRATLLAPSEADPRVTRASVERSNGRLTEAARQCRLALAYQPADPGALMTLGAAYQEMRETRRAIIAYRRTLTREPGYVDAERNLLYALLHLPEVTEAEMFRAAVAFAARHQPPAADRLPPPQNDADPDRRLRVGYVSSDFCDHPNRWFMNALFEYRNAEAVSIVCYSAGHRNDRETFRIRSKVDAWREITGMKDAAVARGMRDDAIDVAVFIGGRFDGNRPVVAAYRPSPVQVSYLDGGTSAIDNMDYWITDDTLHPEGETAERFTEELFRLPVFYSFTRPMPPIPVGPLPAPAGGGITFGSFAQPTRVTDEVLDVWVEVLAAIPASRLLLKSRNRYGDASNRSALARGFAARGIAPERLVIEVANDDHDAHLAHYAKVDIALDTFPFSGATTNFEALWMGIPVVTLPGTRFTSRMGAAILASAGLSEWIATTRQDYVRIATGLARDLDRLSAIRHGLRARMAKSPLCDGPAYARSMEAAYRAMWVRWCRHRVVEGSGKTRS